MISDTRERELALDPTQSFIIQAPAGSGKTQLLTQRFLSLLKTVETPEHILAITFTRKAANEMRERILLSLPSSQKDLINNPNRLRILTIDAFCASLTRQMPILSQCGYQPSVSEQPWLLYQQAGLRLLQRATPDVLSLLAHLDNQGERVIQLISTLLAAREQWLPWLFSQPPQTLRESLEQDLETLVQHTINKLNHHFPQDLLNSLWSLWQWSQQTTEEFTYQLSQWQTLANWLLTQQGTWRKVVNKNQGFPAGKYPEKQALLNLLKKCQACPNLNNILNGASHLPQAGYTESQWSICQILINLLPLACAELKLIFQQASQVDFSEISLSSLFALGAEDNPSDLALKLDYKIQHILVDEFQDTAQTQFRLLELLTAGWVPGDGRTLFCVGDPMQSIYRFRQGDVGLFLSAQAHGIGPVGLTPLALKSNFRTHEDLIKIFNQLFPKIFPAEDDSMLSAVKYTPAQATQNTGYGMLSPHLFSDKNTEYQNIITIIQTLTQNADHSVAILVRARSQIAGLLERLKQANIKYQAIDWSPLLDLPVIQDLWSLTRALLHPADNLAWLSCLNAPWCGLDQKDLLILAERAAGGALWPLTDISLLSLDGQASVRSFRSIMQQALDQRNKLPLRDWIEQTWHQLQYMNNNPDIEQFFHCLENQTDLDIQQFQTTLTQLTSSMPEPAQVQIMTIHKAKGLEFDTVILPSLEKTNNQNNPQLLLWEILPEQRLLAPIKHCTEKSDNLYNYVQSIKKQKDTLEQTRLLYVAMTRAKQQLYLTACTQDSELTKFKPRQGSFLAMLWAELHSDFCDNYQDYTPYQSFIDTPRSRPQRRKNPPILDPIILPEQTYHIDLSDDTERQYGILVHQVLEYYPKLPANLTKELKNLIKKLEQDPNFTWLYSPTHQQVFAEYALNYSDNKKIIIDRLIIDKNGNYWIIDFKTSNKQKPEHLEQVNFYASLLCQQISQPIHCGLYYTETQHWQTWRIDENSHLITDPI